MSLGIFVPAYNVGRHLAQTIGRIPPAAWDDAAAVSIIDDGSSDETPQVAQQLAGSNPKVRVRRLERNQGYGTVVRAGLALCQDEKCDTAVCLHGDGQYPPEEIPRFTAHLRQQRLDILQGSRIASGTALSGGMPVYKYLANRGLTAMENLVFGLRMSDYHSGFLCYSGRAMARIRFGRLSRSFVFDLEVIASAVAAGLAVAELPIPTHYGDETSHVSPVAYGLRCLGVTARYLAGGYRP